MQYVILFLNLILSKRWVLVNRQLSSSSYTGCFRSHLRDLSLSIHETNLFLTLLWTDRPRTVEKPFLILGRILRTSYSVQTNPSLLIFLKSFSFYLKLFQFSSEDHIYLKSLYNWRVFRESLELSFITITEALTLRDVCVFLRPIRER